MQKPKPLQNNSLLALLCVLAFALNFYAYYPGYASPDTFDQYHQALAHTYHDWHPPIMAFVWSFLAPAKYYAAPMLALQLLMLWGACFFIAACCNKWVAKLGVIMLFVTMPFVQNFAGYVIKDSQMAFAWLLSVSMGYYYYKLKKQRVLWALLSLLFLIYGTWLRYNAVFALAPLCMLWVVLFIKPQNRLRELTTAVLLLLSIWFAEKCFKIALQCDKQHPEFLLYMHDMSGLLVSTGTNVFPAEFFADKNFDTAYIRSHYQLASIDKLWWNTDGKTLLPQSIDPEAGTYKRAWIHAISKHPIAYLRNRANGFLYFLRIKKSTNFFINYYFFVYPGLGTTSERHFAGPLINWVSMQSNTPYMQPWFWLLFNLLLFAFSRNIKEPFKKKFFLLLLSSSICYALPQFFLFTTDTDFRYWYWNCLAISFSFFLLLSSGIENKAIRS